MFSQLKTCKKNVLQQKRKSFYNMIYYNFSIVNALKVPLSSQNTGYDAMNILRQNIKKIEHLENSGDLEKSQNDNHKDLVVKSNKSTDLKSEDGDIEDNVKRKQVYHSSSDDDSDQGEPCIKSKKSNKQKVCSDFTTKKDSDLQKDDTQYRENDNSSSGGESRRLVSILLSATLTQAVEKLAGLAMNHPVFIDAAKENLETTGGDVSDLNEDLVVPQSMNQSYIITPPKLRMVTLSAYIAGKCQVNLSHQTIYSFFIFI